MHAGQAVEKPGAVGIVQARLFQAFLDGGTIGFRQLPSQQARQRKKGVGVPWMIAQHGPILALRPREIAHMLKHVAKIAASDREVGLQMQGPLINGFRFVELAQVM